MSYKWTGMRILPWEKIMILHEKGELEGCYKLYPDGTEGQIESGYKWRDIEKHHKSSGEFGEELSKAVPD